MKRKIFSKLLMVALVIAAVGSFVSCKDYDDDINNLQKQIDAKAAISELTALQSTLDSKIAAAQSAAAAAQATADAAATKTALADLKTALETAIADAKKAGTDAGTKAGEAIAAANKAQETADGAAAAAKKADEDAKAALADALKTIAETYETKADAAAKAAETKEAINAVKEALAAVKQTADAAFTKAEAEKLQEQVNNLKSELEAAIDEKIDAKIQEVNNAVASVDAIWSAVTSVELIDSYTGNSQGFGLNDVEDGILDLVILHGKVGTSSVFGDDEASWATADPTKEYTADADINFESAVIVRVNPVNADITDANILLVNSKGEALDDYVVVKKVERFNDLITRGTTLNTGLWKVYFTMVDGKSIKDIKIAANDGVELNNAGEITEEGTPILYAVAINNSADQADGLRFVTSSYDLGVDADDYVPAFTFGYKVNKKAVEDIKNRWTGEATQGEGELSTTVVEYQWKASTTTYPTPATEIKFNSSGVAQNAQISTLGNLLKDKRYEGKKYLPVEVGVPFTVSGIIGYDYEDAIEAYWDAADGYAPQSAPIEWYYVVLDEPRAISSAPSEINAWKSYEYEGLGVMTPAGKSLDITIKSKSANGDIIGFRVFAVNYDGTLADPDGRAFYVAVGNAAEGGSVDVSYVADLANEHLNPASYDGVKAATNDISAYVEIPSAIQKAFKDAATFANYGSEDFASGDYPSSIKTNKTVTLHWGLYKDAKGATATKWSEAKYIKVVADTPEWQVDESVLTFTIEGLNENDDRVVNSLTVNVKKTLPESGDGVEWRTTMGPVDGVLTVYPSPSDASFSTGTNQVHTITAVENNPINPTTDGLNEGEFGIVWPTAAQLKGNDVICAIVDLGGYAVDLDKDTYDWEITGLLKNQAATQTSTATVLLPGVEYADDNLEGQGQFALAINKKDMNTTKDSKIYASYPGISLATSTSNPTTVRFTAWEGKIKFASIFNELFQYGNGSYSAWALNPVKNNALKTDFYYFYGEPGILQGKFDVTTFVKYRKNTGTATSPVYVDDNTNASSVTQAKYMDIIGSGYYANATAEETTDEVLVTPLKYKYTVPEWGHAYEASNTDASEGGDSYPYFAAWNTENYPALKMITVDWVGTTTDEKQTSKLKAQNAGLIPEGELSDYITIGTGDCTLTTDAATVMTAKIDETEDDEPVQILVLTNRAGNVVTAKKADQKITLTSVTDQFGIKLTTQPSITFTLMPETSGVENGK